jgi:hypothetical protein
MIRLAATMPAGSSERKALLSVIAAVYKTREFGVKVTEKDIQSRARDKHVLISVGFGVTRSPLPKVGKPEFIVVLNRDETAPSTSNILDQVAVSEALFNRLRVPDTTEPGDKKLLDLIRSNPQWSKNELAEAARQLYQRRAATMPAGSSERKALPSVIAAAQGTALDATSMSMRGEEAGRSIEQMAKNLQQAMLRNHDSASTEKWVLRLFGIMLKEGMNSALDGWHDDLAREAYALGQKMQQRYK